MASLFLIDGRFPSLILISTASDSLKYNVSPSLWTNAVIYETITSISTWMGDRLWAGIPSWYVTSQPGQLSLASHRGRLVEYQKKSAFRFTSCHAVFLVYLLYSLSQKIS